MHCRFQVFADVIIPTLHSYLQHIGGAWYAGKGHTALYISAAAGAPSRSSQVHALDSHS